MQWYLEKDFVVALVSQVSQLCRMMPQAAALLEDQSLDRDVVLIGERAPVRKVPATTEDRQLPPTTWEDGWLTVNRALVLIMVSRAAGANGTFTTRSMRGEMPALPPFEQELLRVEYNLPQATRQQDAEKVAGAAVRK